MNILLQILDEGRINDAQGRTVDFSNTVIVMTSNAGSQFKDTSLGFGTSKAEQNRDHAMKALREFLRPEFIGRVDEVVLFNDLSDKDYEDIAVLMIGELIDPLKDKGILLSYDETLPAALRERMDSTVRGARDLRNVIRRNIEDPIADLIISADGAPVSHIHVSVEDGEIVVKSL